MNWPPVIALLAGCVVLLVLEARGVKTTLSLTFRGDIKRETRWLAQYGQFVCTALAAVLVLQLDPGKLAAATPVVLAPVAASIAAMIVKRIVGRARPNRENAGKFLGPSWTHANWRESFPSSHSACAVALTTVLAALYPPAALTFWTMALICAGLRYVLDAHWPSDVLAGIALGYGVGHATLALLATPLAR